MDPHGGPANPQKNLGSKHLFPLTHPTQKKIAEFNGAIIFKIRQKWLRQTRLYRGGTIYGTVPGALRP